MQHCAGRERGGSLRRLQKSCQAALGILPRLNVRRGTGVVLGQSVVGLLVRVQLNQTPQYETSDINEPYQKCVCCFLGPPEDSEELSGAVVGVSFSVPEAILDCLGSLGRLGSILVCMEAFWGILAAFVPFLGGFVSLGCISEVVWESLGPPGLSWGSPWALELTAPRKSTSTNLRHI